MSDVAQVARLHPYFVQLQPRQTVRWCSCGRSKQQPYCDGSHIGTGFQPLRHVAQDCGEEALLCACKHTCTPPHCDGSHNALVGRYGTDDPLSESNAQVALVEADPDGKARLDGSCFVCSVESRPARQRGQLSWREIIVPADGALHQAQFRFDLPCGSGPVTSFGPSHVTLLCTQGTGELEISGRRFALNANTGAYVRPGETFRLINRGGAPLQAFVSVGPVAAGPAWPAAMNTAFDVAHPQRTAAVDPAQRQAMAERYFQMLMDKRHGSRTLTQFIGEIPRSKAHPHRHLYEESLIVMSGEGVMWTDSRKAAVRAGDVIFLPRKQRHSLECTSEAPMLVAGVICPGDNPAINYYE